MIKMIEQIIILIVISGPIIYEIIKYYINNNYIIIKASEEIEPHIVNSNLLNILEENILKEPNPILIYSPKRIISENKVRSLRRKRKKQYWDRLKNINYIYTLPLENNQMSPRARQLYEKYGAIAIE